MNGDIAKVNARIDDLVEHVNHVQDDMSEAERAIHARLVELTDRLNQEESDRTSADTSLEDRIADLEAGR